jgi:hypothetical protein
VRLTPNAAKPRHYGKILYNSHLSKHAEIRSLLV